MVAGSFRELLRETLSSAPLTSVEEGSPAAVVVPVVEAPEPMLIFTKRRDDLRRHPGEISFPGGMPHREDEDLLATALRETEEELGIPPSQFDVLGYLEPLHTYVTGILITPVVGVLPERPELLPNPAEIEEVLEVPLRRLAQVERAAEYRREGIVWRGYEYPVDGHVIWGATGKILHGFLELSRPALREAG